MKAKFATRCPTCGDGIEPGEDISMTPEGAAHFDCPEETVTSAPLCRTCFIYHRGECP